MIEDGIKHCLHQAFLDLGYQLESFEEGGFDYEEFKKVVLDIEGKTKYNILIEVSNPVYTPGMDQYIYVFDTRFKTSIGTISVRHKLEGDNIVAVERFIEGMYMKLGCFRYE